MDLVRSNLRALEHRLQHHNNICFEHSDAEDEDEELRGGAHPLAEEEEESEDELLLTTRSTKALAVDIEQFKQKL